MKKTKKLTVFTLILLTMIVTGCSKSYGSQLADAWYREGKDSPSFILYSDGTCEIDGEYGTGKWAVVNDNQLKLTNFYGETQTVTIASIEDGCLTVTNGGDKSVKYWNSPQ